jgi:hypothetical protein
MSGGTGPALRRAPAACINQRPKEEANSEVKRTTGRRRARRDPAGHLPGAL